MNIKNPRNGGKREFPGRVPAGGANRSDTVYQERISAVKLQRPKKQNFKCNGKEEANLFLSLAN